MSNRNNEMPEMRGIQAFVAVMASGSMTGAAKQLGIGQPVITRVIRDLEATIGFAVFDRNGPRISPTPKGLKFFEDAQRLLSGYEQLADRAAELRDAQARSLTIAATPTMASGLVPSMLSSMNDVLPATVSLKTLDAEHLVESLLSGAVDYGICALPLAHAGIECLAICSSKLVAVLPKDHSLNSVSFDLFSDKRLLTLANSYRIRHKIDMVLNERGISCSKTLTTNNSLNAILSARAGLGIAIVDPVTAYGVGVHGVKVVPIEQDIPYEWGLFRRVGQDDSAFGYTLNRAFLDVSKTISDAV